MCLGKFHSRLARLLELDLQECAGVGLESIGSELIPTDVQVSRGYLFCDLSCYEEVVTSVTLLHWDSAI